MRRDDRQQLLAILDHVLNGADRGAAKDYATLGAGDAAFLLALFLANVANFVVIGFVFDNPYAATFIALCAAVNGVTVLSAFRRT